MFGFGKKSAPKAKKVGKEASLPGAFPVFMYEDNKVIFKDGRVGIGFKIEAAEMERWSQDDFNAAFVGFQTACKTLPPGSVVQKTDIFYDRPYVHEPTPGQYFSQRMGDYFSSRLVLYYSGYLFLSFAPKPPKKNANSTKLKSPPPTTSLNALINKADEKLPENIFASIKATMADAERSASEFAEAMRALPDVKLTRMGEVQIKNLYLQYMNLDFDSQPKHYEREILNEVGTLAVGEIKANCISLQGQGQEVYPCVSNSYNVVSPMVYPLTNFLLMPHIFTQAIQVRDTKAELASLDKDARLNSGLQRFGTQDNIIRMEEIAMFSAEVRAENKELCYLHCNLLIWETSDKLRQQNVEAATAAMRSIFSSEAVVETWLTLPLFIASLPGNGYQVPDRWIPTTTDRAACYFHWNESYRSTRTGEYVCDRFRNLKRINLFDLKQDNQNSITIGPSGSGKSYTMGNFIVQRYENGARQIIIDVGGSYRNVCQALTGNDFNNCYFEYDPANPIEFNPFFLPRHEKNRRWLYNDEKVTFHLSLLGTLWKATGTLSRAETVVMARFLRDYYDYLNEAPTLGTPAEEFPGMDSFFQFVKREHDLMMATPAQLAAAAASAEIAAAHAHAALEASRRVTHTDDTAAEQAEKEAEQHAETANLAQMAQINREADPDFIARREQYIKDIQFVTMNEFFLIVGEFSLAGRYSKVLNARRDVDLSEYPLICFDMVRVKADPTLYPVVAMLITELSLDLFRKYPNEVKYLLLDEAWSMLSGALMDFIENMYRTIRKAKGSIGIITQGIAEIAASPIGTALIDNSATRIILRHSSEAARNRLMQPLGFNPDDMAKIASMRSGTGYREFFVKQGLISTVFTLEAAPQLNAILTSQPDERNYLNRLVKFFQRNRPVPVLDAYGRHQTDEHGQPMYTIVTEPGLAFAVDAFVATGGVQPTEGPLSLAGAGELSDAEADGEAEAELADAEAELAG